ncbi:AMP-binding protein, partial [Kaarinaea lacus]
QTQTLAHIFTVDGLLKSPKIEKPVAVGAQSVAFLQYTSGSTGNPKGVVLTHANLLANIRAMGQWVQASADDVFVSWLPLYHDMGLIGAWLGSMYYAFLFVVMSPLTFLRHPERWLWAIHDFKGTLSAAPNFGYELCIRRIKPELLYELDLSSWRAAFNGAEAISADTLLRFHDKFQHYGFRREAIMPVYGLAENSVGLAFPPLNRGPLIDSIRRDSFSRQGKALPAKENDENALRFVACGYPLAQHQIRIVDAANSELPERQEGRIQFQGPSSTSGYFRNPADTKRLFQGDWLDSGDLGYIANGEIYITGRIKDIIIRAGRNIYPHELEETVGNIDGVRAGRVAAFGHSDTANGTEKLVIVAETRETQPQRLQGIRSKINSVVNALAGTPPDDVVLAPPNTILKTSSGKLRRTASRELYEKGHIGKKSKPVWLQISRFLVSGLHSETQKLFSRISALAYGVYSRGMFWLLAVFTWTSVVLAPRAQWCWSIMRFAIATLSKLSGTNVQVSGLENLPDTQQTCVYVANHSSYLDALIIIHSIQRQVSFVAKSELQQNVLSRLFLDRINTAYVERIDIEKGIEHTKELIASLQQGQSAFFFPEGTFVRNPGLLPFRLGAFVAAAEAQVPVVPVCIRGSRSILRANSWLPRHGAIQVSIGKPIQPIAAQDETSDKWAVAKQLRDTAREQILSHCGEPDLAATSQIFEKA